MSDSSRRKLLKSIAAGSGAVIAGKSLPEKLTKPVVDSVMLPAHAQTSPPVEPTSYSATSPEIVYVQANTSTGEFTVNINTSPGVAADNIRFDFDDATNFSYGPDFTEWTAAGSTPAGSYPYGAFSATLVGPSTTFTLNATVTLSGVNTITVSGLSIT